MKSPLGSPPSCPFRSLQLASSLFCGVLPGDGFSARMEDAMLHGCIPVIVQVGPNLQAGLCPEGTSASLSSSR